MNLAEVESYKLDVFGQARVAYARHLPGRGLSPSSGAFGADGRHGGVLIG